VYTALFGDADVSRHLSSRAGVAAMLEVEAVLAESQGALDIIPAAAAGQIAATARAYEVDFTTLSRDTAVEGNLAIPLVRQLRAAVAARDPQAADWVHFGATSQDILDTALVMQLTAAVPLIAQRLDAILATAARHAKAHATTPMAGRTWLQQATPVTFGLTAAGWADLAARGAVSLRRTLGDARVVQLGGASGTLAAMGPHGIRVMEEVARRLALAVPARPWHTERDRLVALGCALGLACGALGKIARDISLLTQTEVGEVTMSGGGGSSTMPHKRNPVGCAVALAAATRAPGLVATLLAAMPQELERGLGGWHAEWETLVELVSITGGAARAMDESLAALTVDPGRMQQNLALTQGANLAEAYVVALSPHLGRERAHGAVAHASARAIAEKRSMADLLSEDHAITGVVDRTVLQQLLDPARYLGAAAAFVDRVIDVTKRSRE
jgi:3-carboxy-cis,cis-muconate cycloisomerase